MDSKDRFVRMGIKMKKISKFVFLLVIIFSIYGAGYMWFRNAHIQVWEKDRQAYVIFPADKVFVYYLFRPLTYIDGSVTGMRFHIGPHR